MAAFWLVGTHSLRALAAAPVVLVDPDPELEAALRLVLRPWGTVVAIERSNAPGNAMPGSADRARALARKRQGEAVIWISRSSDGPALWLYDTEHDRVMARRLPSEPPFDPPTAASVALIVKTLLRHSDVPPTDERVQLPMRRRWLSLGLLTGARFHPSEAAFEPRLGFSAIGWPIDEEFELGVGLELASGIGVEVRDDRFEGRFTESALQLSAHARRGVGATVDLGVALAGGFSLTSMSGTVLSTNQASSELRVNFVLSVHGETGYRLSENLRLGLRGGVTHPFRTQRYVVHGVPLYEVAPLLVDALLAAELALP